MRRGELKGLVEVGEDVLYGCLGFGDQCLFQLRALISSSSIRTRLLRSTHVERSVASVPRRVVLQTELFWAQVAAEYVEFVLAGSITAQSVGGAFGREVGLDRFAAAHARG